MNLFFGIRQRNTQDNKTPLCSFVRRFSVPFDVIKQRGKVEDAMCLLIKRIEIKQDEFEAKKFFPMKKQLEGIVISNQIHQMICFPLLLQISRRARDM